MTSCCSFFFFFSSRRRHTRLQGDWSSDVCSSDLRLSLTFYSKFWRVYRSGIFGLRGELAMDSWSRGTAGLDSAGTPRAPPGAGIARGEGGGRVAGGAPFLVPRNGAPQAARHCPWG